MQKDGKLSYRLGAVKSELRDFIAAFKLVDSEQKWKECQQLYRKQQSCIENSRTTDTTPIRSDL